LLEGDKDITATAPFRMTDGKPFVAGEDWIKNLKVVIRNDSIKEVNAGIVLLSFPETGMGTVNDLVATVSIMLGEHLSGLVLMVEGSKHLVKSRCVCCRVRN
jgi:hypothetical protein